MPNQWVLARALSGEEVASSRLVIPKGPIQLKALAAVLAHEQPTGNRPHVHHVSRGKRKNPKLEKCRVFEGRPFRRFGSVLGGLGRGEVPRALRVFDLRRIVPRFPVITRTRELGAPMAVPKGCPEPIRVRVPRNIVDADARVPGKARFPTAVLFLNDEGSLTRADQDPVCHVVLPRGLGPRRAIPR